MDLIVRFWKNWRRKHKLLASQFGGARDSFVARELFYSEYQDLEESGQPTLPPYEGLSEFWDAYASQVLPDYLTFLASLALQFDLKLESILDLACGTGILSGQLKNLAAEVVGLDLSGPMLSQARERYVALPEIEFLQGDFRSFRIDRQFDAAICAFNSLNYLGDDSELWQVFDAVAKHLRPGGLFLFDTITEYGMFCLSGCYAHIPLGGRRLVMRCDYDLENRRETVQVFLPAGVEIHQRIPIGAKEILAAAKGGDLEVVDYFCHAWIPDRWLMGRSCFAVLRKR